MHINFKFIKIKTVYCLVTTTVIFLILYLNNTSYIKKTKVQVPGITNKPFTDDTTTHAARYRPYAKTKYILLWTNHNLSPFVYFGEGNSVFKSKNCEYINCFVTSNRELLKDITEFDIVAFNGPQLSDVLGNEDKPERRSARQKYVYANIEAAVNYPICKGAWDNYFNWTWTYKLNSDAVWGYIVIKNKRKHVIGPKIDMEWMSIEDMDPIDNDFKLQLASKNKAAAWFVSNCNTMSQREKFVNALQNYLGDYNLKVDIYGSCGTFQCPKTIMSRCLKVLENDYYFYLAFENAMSEDYVTEKVLNAVNHNTVPIVYGGADYTRFLPPDSYLDAYKLGAKALAKEMNDIIENKELYYRYFRWQKYYTIRRSYESPETDEYCKFCAMANDENLMNEVTIYSNLSGWWTPPGICTDT